MSLIDTSFVQVVAEGLGIKADEDTAKTLAPDVEYRLREIVQVHHHLFFPHFAHHPLT